MGFGGGLELSEIWVYVIRLKLLDAGTCFRVVSGGFNVTISAKKLWQTRQSWRRTASTLMTIRTMGTGMMGQQRVHGDNCGTNIRVAVIAAMRKIMRLLQWRHHAALEYFFTPPRYTVIMGTHAASSPVYFQSKIQHILRVQLKRPGGSKASSQRPNSRTAGLGRS